MYVFTVMLMTIIVGLIVCSLPSTESVERAAKKEKEAAQKRATIRENALADGRLIKNALNNSNTPQEKATALRSMLVQLATDEQRPDYWRMLSTVSASGLVAEFPDALPSNDELPYWARRGNG